MFIQAVTRSLSRMSCGVAVYELLRPSRTAHNASIVLQSIERLFNQTFNDTTSKAQGNENRFRSLQKSIGSWVAMGTEHGVTIKSTLGVRCVFIIRYMIAV